MMLVIKVNIILMGIYDIYIAANNVKLLQFNARLFFVIVIFTIGYLDGVDWFPVSYKAGLSYMPLSWID